MEHNPPAKPNPLLRYIADSNTPEARELSHIIENFLETLTIENRVIFMRRYWFSDSCKDIAGRVGFIDLPVSARK